MPADIYAKISPSLHPENVRQIEGYDESTRPFLAATETAFSAAYEGLRAVWEARAAAEKNRGWNEDQRVIQVSRFASKKMDQVVRGFDSSLATLGKQIAHVEGELATPIESKAATGIAAEIRAYAKALSTKDRIEFTQQAISGGDSITMGALLGAPSYLSGLNVEMQKSLLRQFRAKMEPEKAQRLKAMQGAKALIEERAGLIFGEMEKAVGAPFEKAKTLSDTQAAALAALEVK